MTNHPEIVPRGAAQREPFLHPELTRSQILPVLAQRDGTLHKSELAGGKNGTNMRYTMEEVRGDVVRWCVCRTLQ